MNRVASEDRRGASELPGPAAARRGGPVWRRYGAYLRRAPRLVVEWHDDRTPARGWLVINSLRGGAAGGGTRMRAGLSRREVVYLAKTMELKFVFSGPPIGGAKSGIDFDPADPRREEVLRRWFAAMAPHLRACYGTGGDLNVDEVLDVIPACERLGLSHPQEGVVRGHLRLAPEALPAVFDSLDRGVRAPVNDGYGVAGTDLPVADLITGYGLARSILHFLERREGGCEGRRAVLEGFGAVGGPCALYLARAGVRVVAISDREKTLVEPGGLDAPEIERLLRSRAGKCLPADDRRCAPDASRLDRVPADVFVCAAASGTVDGPRLERLARQGIEVIACGANQPFREAKLGATRVQRLADEHFTVIPDVVANCGMARAFSYLMQSAPADGPAGIFHAVDATIDEAMEEISARTGGSGTGLLAAALGYALDRIDAD